MPAFQVLLTDYAWPDLDIEREILSAADAELIVADDTSPAGLSKAAAQVDAIMTCWVNVPAEVIGSARRCRIVARLGIGLDNIDVAAATAHGMAVTNVPDYCLAEVAEHTLALLLALARNVARFHWETKQGRYDLLAAPPMRRVAGQTLGLIGYGRIGSTVGRLASAIGLRVLAHTREERSLEGATWCELDELLSTSDYVSLHLPLTDESHHLIGAAQLERMKPTACLINTARGGLVDHAALAEALAEDRLGGAALDVHEPEPPDLSRPLYHDPRVIVTPHAAFSSIKSLADLRRRATQGVVDCLRGRTPANLVNAEGLGRGA